jgi:ATP-binding cassette subfamily B protein
VIAVSVGGLSGPAQSPHAHQPRYGATASKPSAAVVRSTTTGRGLADGAHDIGLKRLANILAVSWISSGATMMIGIAIAMLTMNAKLAVLALAVIPVLGWVSAKFQKRILKSAREVRRTNSRITASYNESIMGVLTSKAFVREQENLSDFKQLTDGMYGASVQNQIQAAIYVPIVLTLASLASG